MPKIDRADQRAVKWASECKEYVIPQLPHYEEWAEQYLDDDEVDMITLLMEFEEPTIWLHPSELEKDVLALHKMYDEWLVEHIAKTTEGDPRSIEADLLRMRHRRGRRSTEPEDGLRRE